MPLSEVVNPGGMLESPATLVFHSAAIPDGRALPQEGGRSLSFIFRAAGQAEARGFQFQGGSQGQVKAGIHCLDATANCQRGIGGDRCGQGLSAWQQFFGGNDFVDESNTQSLHGRDHFAREQHFERGPFADQAGQSLTSAVTGDEADLYLGLAEPGAVAGNPDGTGHRQFTAAAEGKSINGGNDRFATIFDKVEHCLAACGEGLALVCVDDTEFVDICAGGECFFTCAGQDHSADFQVSRQFKEHCFQIVEQPAIQRIHDLGPVERHGGYVLIQVKVEMLVGHDWCSLGWDGGTRKSTKIGLLTVICHAFASGVCRVRMVV